MNVLAKQLLREQGSYRYSIENRLIILFDCSPTSSVAFLRRNEMVMINKLVEMKDDPPAYWTKIRYYEPVWNMTYEPYMCIILIPQGEYYPVYEEWAHPLGEGLREKGKAEYAAGFMTYANWATEGMIEPEPNIRLHGIDGYISFTVEDLQKIDEGVR